MTDSGDGGILGRQSGVSEITRVDTTTQIRIPFLRFIAIWWVSSTVLFAAYIGLKFFIKEVIDWQWFISVSGALIIIALAIHLAYYPIIEVGRYEYDIRMFISFLARLQRSRLIPVTGIILAFLGALYLMYFEWLLPIVSYTLNNRADIIFVLVMFVGLTIAARSFVYHHAMNLTNSLLDSDWHVKNKDQDIAWEREKFYYIASQQPPAEPLVIDQPVAPREVVRFVPHNHGGAIGQKSFDATYTKDQERLLCKYITGWAERGAGRDNWTTPKARERWGYTITEAEWDKFTATLRTHGILDERNKPVVSAEDALHMLGIEPDDSPALSPNGGAEFGSEAIPDPTRPDPTPNVLEQAIKKLPRANRTKT